MLHVPRTDRSPLWNYLWGLARQEASQPYNQTSVLTPPLPRGGPKLCHPFYFSDLPSNALWLLKKKKIFPQKISLSIKDNNEKAYKWTVSKEGSRHSHGLNIVHLPQVTSLKAATPIRVYKFLYLLCCKYKMCIKSKLLTFFFTTHLNRNWLFKYCG